MTQQITEIIQISDLKRDFKVGEIIVNALRGVNLTVHKGEFIVILGASGSGKTTLLNQIGGIDLPTSGTITVDGENITHFKDKDLTKHRRSKIGWIFQFHNLIPSLTTTENVMLALEMMNDKEDQRKKSNDALRLVGLEEEIDRFPSQISGGQQQRVAIARALVKKPSIIVADEPTGNLDTTTSRTIKDLMRQLCTKEKITFIVVTHDPDMATIADRVLIMEDGVLYEHDQEKLARFGLKG